MHLQRMQGTFPLLMNRVPGSVKMATMLVFSFVSVVMTMSALKVSTRQHVVDPLVDPLQVIVWIAQDFQNMVFSTAPEGQMIVVLGLVTVAITSMKNDASCVPNAP
eukprot:gnl/MRDRNA2_/MRDRNA2_85763_c0_seq3.p4 gnl/MRDRNA2_/MRDRNA2_85763_c0~~gnl/MRDRNA2_/MRDRNA2_85763_c0_seq3.p4  ORF type:complete len:106 (+),score=14.11 gnl/MRDRNA2_/MRDRNA2_85763_c0_seq3:183-500(+)